jgi:hypothetical protein
VALVERRAPEVKGWSAEKVDAFGRKLCSLFPADSTAISRLPLAEQFLEVNGDPAKGFQALVLAESALEVYCPWKGTTQAAQFTAELASALPRMGDLTQAEINEIGRTICGEMPEGMDQASRYRWAVARLEPDAKLSEFRRDQAAVLAEAARNVYCPWK